jgi:hypothetical protein
MKNFPEQSLDDEHTAHSKTLTDYNFSGSKYGIQVNGLLSGVKQSFRSLI